MNNTVTLNTSANPALTINPDDDYVAANTNVTITWSRGSTSEAFTFAELTGLSGGPFSGLSISANSISVSDNNAPLYGNRDYPYALTVTTANGTRYTANAQSGNPKIHNN